MKSQAEVNKRLKWIHLYEQFQNSGVVCLRCGISRPTLRKWVNRYKNYGLEGLKSHSRKPHSSPALKASKKLQYWSYVANFTAQFKQTLAFLEKYPDKEIVLHVTGVGLGVFGSKDPALANAFNQTFAEAFKHTGSLFQNMLSEKDRKRVHVQLESYKGQDALKDVCVDHLKLGSPSQRL